MKLFVVREVLYDFSSGMVAIKALDMVEARSLFVNWLESALDADAVERYVKEFDKSIGAGYFHTFELTDSDKNKCGIVTQMWGGS